MSPGDDMTPAIRVENLSKRYRVTHNRQRSRYRTLRDTLVDAARAPFRRWIGGESDPAVEDFWALQDVSFEVQPGEVVGIIGRNGAGKSTLLKVLSRITRPTKGRVELNGRVGSLLEVGTGFHHELTGRENIYLNGSILGMKREEIDRKFDEIVSFAGVEQFLDIPVKRYSSGMYVRLAFAVAAHLEPEIMLVDEVLAVGDADFQKKCFEKLDDVSRSGRTVFLVSHQLPAVRRLCNRAILLDRGALKLMGDRDTVINEYLATSRSNSIPGVWVEFPPRIHSPHVGGTTGQAWFRAARYLGPDGSHPTPDNPLSVSLNIDSLCNQSVTNLGLTISDRYGSDLIVANIKQQAKSIQLAGGMNTVTFHLQSLHLVPGVYKVGLVLGNAEDFFDRLPDAFQIEVVTNDAVDPVGGERSGFVTNSFTVTDGG